MLVDEFIKIKIASKHVKHYTNLGYTCKVGDLLEIKTIDLQKGSDIKVNAMCTICNKVNNINYNNYVNKQLKRHNFYVCVGCSRIKKEKTNLKKYGVKYFSELGIFKSLVEKKSLEKWGVENYTKTEEYKTKTAQTNLKKYGETNPMKSEEYKENFDRKIIEKYGVDNIVKINGNNIEKRCKTNLNKYGVEHAIQNSEIFLKNLKKRKKINNLYYDSSYELDFINFCINNNIVVEKPSTIYYYLNNKKKAYYPDFYLPKYNLICEIKSTYTYNYDVKKNQLKKKSCIDNNYNFLFIIDKNLEELKNIYLK